MAEALSGPVTQVLDGLCGSCDVEPAEMLIAADYAHHFDVDDRWGCVISVLQKAGPYVIRPFSVGHDLVQT